jgi:hypothetical protein
VILQYLLENGPTHGYQIHTASELSDKTIYVSLKALKQKGLVTASAAINSSRKKTNYYLTFYGLWIALTYLKDRALDYNAIVNYWTHLLPTIFSCWQQFSQMRIENVIMDEMIKVIADEGGHLFYATVVESELEAEKILIEGLIFNMEEKLDNPDIFQKWIQFLQSNNQWHSYAIQYIERLRGIYHRGAKYFSRKLDIYSRLDQPTKDLKELTQIMIPKTTKAS